MMRSVLLAVVASSGLLVSAAPAALPEAEPLAIGTFASDVANEMLAAIQDPSKCAPVGIIFARGTFDSENIGVWVGPQLKDGLTKALGHGKFVFQGVDKSAYKADMSGYLNERGSNSGAEWMAKTVEKFLAVCKISTVVYTGWSQGALVAHKGLKILPATSQKRVSGIVTFGDPNGLWDKTPTPAGIPLHSYCVKENMWPDFLCSVILKDFRFPRTISQLVDPFNKLPEIAKGAQQTAAAARLLKAFPGELLGSFKAAVMNLLGVWTAQRLMLTPQHFTYGNNGMAEEAAKLIATLDGVKKALAASK